MLIFIRQKCFLITAVSDGGQINAFVLSPCLLSDGSSEEGESGMGSPSDPCLSHLAWSVTGKYLASAVEKMVNIWQVNGKRKIL